MGDRRRLRQAGLCRLLDGEPDLTVVAEAACGRDAERLCRSASPDVVVLDFGLPDMDGPEATRRLLCERPGTRVLVLTRCAHEDYAVQVMRAGAAGFVAKDGSSDELAEAVRRVAGGGVFVTPRVMERVVDRLQLNPAR